MDNPRAEELIPAVDINLSYEQNVHRVMDLLGVPRPVAGQMVSAAFGMPFDDVKAGNRPEAVSVKRGRRKGGWRCEPDAGDGE